MEYLAIAYGLIAVVLTGYTLSVWRRLMTTERERAQLESKAK
jgi:hypothetical protein